MVAASPSVVRTEVYGEVVAESASLHFCPLCLADDAAPYFRRSWRLHVHRYCPTHQVRLSYRCPQCANSVRPHARRDLGSVHHCHHCGCDLRTSHAAKATPEEVERQFRVLEHLKKLLGKVLFTTAATSGRAVVEIAISVVHGDADILRLHAHHSLPKVERKLGQKDIFNAVIRRLGHRH